MRVRFLSFHAACLALSLILVGCGPQPESPKPVAATPSPTPTPPPEDPQTTRLGFFVPLTGAQSSFGNDALKGATLAVDQINTSNPVFGHPLKLIVKDTKSDPVETAKVVQELIQVDKVTALIGEIASDRTLVAAPIAQQAGIPMVTPAATHQAVTETGDYIFRACYTDFAQAAAMSQFALSIDVKKAAVLYDSSKAYSEDLAETFRKDFIAKGGEIVGEERYETGETDFTRQLTTLKERGPEVIFLPSYYKEAALIISQARKLGLDVPFLGTDGWDSPEFLQVGGEAVNNCYFSSHFAAENKAPQVEPFVKSYTAANNAVPPPLAALSYDSVYLVADALRRAGSPDPKLLRNALAATKDLAGVTGTVTFDAHRNPTKPTLVIRVQAGKFTYLETAKAP